MPRAVWKGAVIAESPTVEVVDGYTYFPAASVRRELLEESTHTSVCGWKGEARYWSIRVEGELNRDAVWSYPETKPAAQHIAGMFSFWRGVDIEP